MSRSLESAAGASASPAEGRVDLKVFISHRDSVCGKCRRQIGHGAWILLAGGRGALCLACADLDHLTFLPSGDAALTRRARKHTQLCAVVLKFSRARRRYERQGLLVEGEALAQAKVECLADDDARKRRRQREVARREEVDQRFVEQFAQSVRAMFPGCPRGREVAIAQHACRKYSGRVGRSAAAKELDERAIRLAVAAHIRHIETDYDALLAKKRSRAAARRQVAERVEQVLATWRTT